MAPLREVQKLKQQEFGFALVILRVIFYGCGRKEKQTDCQSVCRRASSALLLPHQKLVLVFGLEHGCHLLQVQAVPLLLQPWREEDRDDPLRNVGQVEVVVPLHHSVHHPVHTEAPERRPAEGQPSEKREEKEEGDEVDLGGTWTCEPKSGCCSEGAS